MTRLLVAYDGSDSARAALGVAAALFPEAETTVATVSAPAPQLEAGDSEEIGVGEVETHSPRAKTRGRPAGRPRGSAELTA